MRAMVWFVIAMMACGELGHNDYVDARADAECRKIQRCHLGLFEAEYRDFEDCSGDVADTLDDLEDTIYSECDYDGQEARACVVRISNMGCEDYSTGETSNACDLVWECDGLL